MGYNYDIISINYLHSLTKFIFSIWKQLNKGFSLRYEILKPYTYEDGPPHQSLLEILKKFQIY